jgi:hypothetical protein
MNPKPPATIAGVGHNGGPPLYDPAETLLSDVQVEQRWGVKPGYMSEMRAQGIGPPHVRLSPRIIRYRPSVIVAYEQTQSFDSNAAVLEAAKSETLIEEAAPKPVVIQRPQKSSDRKQSERKVSRSRELAAT